MPKTDVKVSKNNINVNDSFLYTKKEIKSTVDDKYTYMVLPVRLKE